MTTLLRVARQGEARWNGDPRDDPPHFTSRPSDRHQAPAPALSARTRRTTASRPAYQVVRDFWGAVATVWPVMESAAYALTDEGRWRNRAEHAGGRDDHISALTSTTSDEHTFAAYLAPLAHLDWSTGATFKGFGGRHGANEAHQGSAGNCLRRAWRWLEPACRESHQCD